eukprot:PhF_6_TR6146/c1_g1_i6/m.9131
MPMSIPHANSIVLRPAVTPPCWQPLPSSTNTTTSAVSTPRSTARLATPRMTSSNPIVQQAPVVPQQQPLGSTATVNANTASYSHWCGVGKSAVPLKGGRRHTANPITTTTAPTAVTTTATTTVSACAKENIRHTSITSTPTTDYNAIQCEGIRQSQRYRWGQHSQHHTGNFHGAGVVPEGGPRAAGCGSNTNSNCTNNNVNMCTTARSTKLKAL